MDPDYELPETILEEANKRREKDKLEQIEKAKAKINEDFQKEFDQREDELMEIQNRITCLAKTLHVLRYVLVSNYYNKPEAQLQISEDELKLVDQQQRLHPAVKKLINERDLVTLDFTKRKTRRKTKPVFVMPIETPIEDEEMNEIKNERINLAPIALQEAISAPRNRQMTKRSLIVGNISKWMPSDNPEDSSTHKWMVYIRGPQFSPVIDDIVDKIIFHLHPSYHPHDVIEVKSHPFHLTRRGWGEFPIRCQMHFKNALNKPVDIIHNLKLDQTFSGRQTIGAETIVELTLYDKIKPQTGVKDEDLASLIESMDFSNTVVPNVKTEIDVIDDDSEEQTDPKETIEMTEEEFLNCYSEGGVVKEEQPNENYNYECAALCDHTYSLKSVSSC